MIENQSLQVSCHVCLIPVIQQKNVKKIGVFLQSKKMAATAIPKLLPLYHDFLTDDWEHCNLPIGTLSYEECG
jgi:hypothetical protein